GVLRDQRSIGMRDSARLWSAQPSRLCLGRRLLSRVYSPPRSGGCSARFCMPLPRRRFLRLRPLVAILIPSRDPLKIGSRKMKRFAWSAILLLVTAGACSVEQKSSSSSSSAPSHPAAESINLTFTYGSEKE